MAATIIFLPLAGCEQPQAKPDLQAWTLPQS